MRFKALFFLLTFISLFYSRTALASSLLQWQTWLMGFGWGSLVIIMLAILGKFLEVTLKEIVPVIISRFFPDLAEKHSAKEKYPNEGRRRFLSSLTNLGIVGISCSIAVRGLSEGLRFPEVKNIDIRFKNLHPDLQDLSIIQISDLHVFPTTNPIWIQNIVDQVNELNPDMIALTGDIVDSDYLSLKNIVAPLAELHSKHGNFFVTGNHEYMVGVEGWMSVMKRLGFTVLHNENRVILQGDGRLLVGGVADYSAPFRSSHESSPAKAITNQTKAGLNMLLAHQPRSIYEAAQAGFDLQLSGLTHGGLLRSTRWLASLAQPFQSGLYKYKDTQIYVSNGTGFWGIPLRIDTPAEITHLKLKSAS